MKEIDKTQLALAHLLAHLYHYEKEATRRLLTTRVFANAACAVAPALERMDKETFDALKKPEIDADEYVLAAMQEMTLAWDEIRELRRQNREWQAKWTKYHNAMWQMYDVLNKGGSK